jgi:transforming growth factor-beta-induced protein
MTRSLIPALLLPLALFACDGGKDTDTDDTDTVETDESDTMEETDMPLPTVVEAVVGTERFSILEEAVLKAGLAGALTDVTVFAPNNDAFEAIFEALDVSGVDDLTVPQLTAILTYHVIGSGDVDSTAAIAAAGTSVDTLGGSVDVTLDGSSLMIDAATVITPDIEASDGIIHEIDAVLVPSIVDVVKSDAQLTTLFAAVGAVDADASDPGIATALSGTGPFTLLAPVDAAFATFLEANELDGLGAVVDALGVSGVVNVLQYHVIALNAPSSVVVGLDGMSVEALNGDDITVDVDGSTVVLNQGVNGGYAGTNDANVIVVDILTSNGVIHKIDKVILPPAAL